MLLRVFICIIEVIICFLLQSTVFPKIALAGVVPDLMMILIVSIAFTRGRTKGMITGLLCGLLVDFSYGELIGVYALMYMVIGYLAGICHRFYDEFDFTTPLLLVGSAEFVFNLIYYVFFYLLQGKLGIGYFIYRFGIPRVVYTVLISILLYKLFNYIHISLENKYSKEAQ